MSRRQLALARQHTGPSDDEAFERYLRYDEMTAWWDDKLARYPHILRKTVLTRTEEDREVRLIKLIASPDRAQSRPVFWIDCGIHAREWISPPTCMYLVKRLLEAYETNEEPLRSQLMKIDVWIVPLVNPDGYAYSFRSNKARFWRKNRQKNPKMATCPGIDLNRNWPAFFFRSNNYGEWSDVKKACRDNYAGSRALLAKESMAMFRVLRKNRWKIKVALTLHSFGQVWLIPFGYSSSKASPGPPYPHFDSTLRFFKPAVEALERKRRSHRKCQAVGRGRAQRNTCKFELGNTVDVLGYAGGGGSDDTMATLGICHVATVELPPTGQERNHRRFQGFVLEPEEIVPTGAEFFEAARVIIEKMQDMSVRYCLPKDVALADLDPFTHQFDDGGGKQSDEDAGTPTRRRLLLEHWD